MSNRLCAVAVLAVVIYGAQARAQTATDSLPDHPFMSGSLGMGLTYQASPASETGQGSFFGRADFQFLAPLWIDIRMRVQPLTQVDTLLGFIISHHNGLEDEVHQQQISETATTRTYAVTAETIQSRSDVVVVGGFKSTSVIMPAKSNGVAMDRQTNAFSILEAGIQWHTATVYGSHRIIELHALRNLSEGTWGATALWHNSLHLSWTSHLVFGMEVGWVPATTGTSFFWSIVDLGYAFEK